MCEKLNNKMESNWGRRLTSIFNRDKKGCGLHVHWPSVHSDISCFSLHPSPHSFCRVLVRIGHSTLKSLDGKGFCHFLCSCWVQVSVLPTCAPRACGKAVDTLEKMRSSRQWSVLPWLPFHIPGSCHVATHLPWRWWAVGLHNVNHRRSLAWEKQLTRNTRITACHIYKSLQLTFFSPTIYAFQCQAVQIPRLFPKWTGVLGVSGAICSNKQT